MPGMKDDRQLVAQAQRGDPEAFAQLVGRYQKMVYNLALGKTGSHHDAEEVTQTAFLKAWQGIRSFQGKAAFSSWLYRLTANAAIDLLRQRRGPALSLDDPGLPPLAGRDPGPEEVSLAAERRRLLWQAIDSLPEAQRTPLVLR
ncbi:MAG TPA: sigma-70 family RNA polymerase sigma factor, partial [Candidatus Evtepia faecigallinarum]|nr:sigma-70 family RNA polymerase sigma factor [Candidatus Evtepia faecigallinarum]